MNTIPDPQENAMVESEVKLAVDALAPIEASLLAAGAVLAAPRILELNNRYDDASGSLQSGHQVLRLRQDSRVRLTYKEPIATEANSELNTRTEMEVTVDNFDTMHQILLKLGYRLVWKYEKYRTTYTFEGCEVVLDELPFGHFVEIEGAPSAVAAARTALGLDHYPHIANSYADLFVALKDALHLNIKNLTFDDFAGITLPRGWATDLPGATP